MSPWAEAALFAAARAELVERVIRPALDRGADVVSDRFVDSSLAYQGIARGLGVEAVLELNREAVQGVLPDRTFLLLVPPEAAGARLGGRRSTASRTRARPSTRGSTGPTVSSPSASPSGSSRSTASCRRTSSPSSSVRARLGAGGWMTAIDALDGQPEARRLLAARARRRARARVPLPRAARGGQARRGARVRGRPARRPRPRRAARASGPLRRRAARRPDPHRRHPRAPARPPPAPLRGGSARLPRLLAPS